MLSYLTVYGHLLLVLTHKINGVGKVVGGSRVKHLPGIHQVLK